MQTLPHLFRLQDRILDTIGRAVREHSADVLSRTARDDEGDTIFGIDLFAEHILLPEMRAWGQETPLRLIAEGIEPEGRCFGDGEPRIRVIVDPVDGSRGLMHDKRSAWSLAAVAEERGEETSLGDVFAAVMTELPTSRHGFVDRLWALRDEPTQAIRRELRTDIDREIAVRPSKETTLHHGFATVSDFFPGGKEILARVADAILTEEMGAWDPNKASVFSDQYISNGGQLAELALGRDRFVMDIRPLVYAKLGVESSLCSRPYDLCTALVAQNAGVVVRTPTGEPLDAPLDVTTNIAFAAYANEELAARMQPMVTRALDAEGLL